MEITVIAGTRLPIPPLPIEPDTLDMAPEKTEFRALGLLEPAF